MSSDELILFYQETLNKSQTNINSIAMDARMGT